MTVFIVTPDAAHAERWETLLHASGRPGRVLPGLNEFERACEGPCLALVDWSLVEKTPQKTLERLKNAVSEAHILLFGVEDVLYGPELSAAINAGAQEFLSISAPNGKLLSTLDVHFASLPAEGTLRVAGVRVRSAHREVSVRVEGQWQVVEGLTPKEFDLLCLFLKSPDVDFSRGDLIDCVWGERGEKVNTEAVDKQIASLRKKLGEQGARIQTRRGRGYCFVSAPTA